jgi:hypothetical protein
MDVALKLIREKVPRRFRELESDVRCILVAGTPAFLGQFVNELRMIELYDAYAINTETTAEKLACTLVHESQHARLFRLGFGYEQDIRGQIERLCFRAERNFAKTLPDGGDLVAQAEWWMEADAKDHFSTEARREADFRALRELGCPEMIIRVVRWIGNKRAT